MIIPVYGQWQVLARCLDSLRVRDDCIREVIVVDDASPDGTGARLGARDDVRVVRLAENRGFAGACNAGAAVATAEAILFLNSDTLVAPGAIAKLAATLDADPTLGAVGPRLLYADRTLQAAGLALEHDLSGVLRVNNHLDADLPQASVPRDDIAVLGAALLVRRALFDAIGGFNEAYRSGWEDIELGVEIWRRGLRCRYEPAATILHLEGASRGRMVDDDANRDLFRERWADKLAVVPRVRLADPPNLAIGWRDRSPLDRAVRMNLRRALRYAGARVSFAHDRAGLLLARVLAVADRRAALSIVYGPGRADVGWLAPRDANDARAARHTRVREFWVPSDRARELLIDAGIAPERLRVTRLGFPAPQARALGDGGAIVVADEGVPAQRLAELRAALGGAATPVDAARCSAYDLLRIRSASLVVFAGDGDPWGLLGGEALAAGAVVVARRSAPFAERLPADAFVALDDPELLADAAADVQREPERYAERGRRAQFEVTHQLADVNAAHRIRELGRALVHGAIGPATGTIAPDVAAALRA